MLQYTASITAAPPKGRLMGEHSSYHQSIPTEEAERRLKLFGTHCYLTRYNENSQCYVLSVYKKQTPDDTIKHFKIEIKENGKYKIDGKDEEFNDIGELLTEYEQNRIDQALKNIGRNCTEEHYEHTETQREAAKRKKRRAAQRRRRVANLCAIL